MASKKKKNFSFENFMDTDELDSLMNEMSAVAPTKEEVEIVKKADGSLDMIPTADLVPYHNHTFRVLDDDDMAALVESIEINGIILPLLVRPEKNGRYEVISGHRRLFAANKLGLDEVPCKVTNVDDSTADIMMVDTNLHREEILPSDKAKSYDLRIKAMQAKGLLSDNEGESSYEEQLAEDVKSSRTTIFRYRKLLDLDPVLLDMVDEKIVAIKTGAKLAGLQKDYQSAIRDALIEYGKPLSMEDGDKLIIAAKSDLTKEKALAVLCGDIKPRKRNKSTSTLSKKMQAVEKNFASAYPDSIKELDGKQKEMFIKDCIKAYIETHDMWNDFTL